MRWPGLQVPREWRAAGGEADLLRALMGETGAVRVYDRPLPSRLQDGPTCGPCVMSIAARGLLQNGTLPENVRDESDIAGLVECARSKGVSYRGEIFDAASLADLAANYYGLSASVVVSPSVVEIWRRLSAGAIGLIAYDRDANNSPRQTGGQNAHWALVRGIAITDSAEDQELSVMVSDIVGSTPEAESAGKRIYLLCQQTKSRWLAAWPASVLLASNAQLRHCKEPDYLVPDDLSLTLASRIVFLST